MYFYNSEHDEFLSEIKLYREYEECKKYDSTESDTFREYISNCTSRNGVLDIVSAKVYKTRHDAERINNFLSRFNLFDSYRICISKDRKEWALYSYDAEYYEICKIELSNVIPMLHEFFSLRCELYEDFDKDDAVFYELVGKYGM